MNSLRCSGSVTSRLYASSWSVTTPAHQRARIPSLPQRAASGRLRLRKQRKTTVASVGGNPMPLSRYVTTTAFPSSAARSWMCPPGAVYLAALIRRLRMPASKCALGSAHKASRPPWAGRATGVMLLCVENGRQSHRHQPP